MFQTKKNTEYTGSGLLPRILAYLTDKLIITAVFLAILYSLVYDPLDYILRSQTGSIIMLSNYILFFELYFTIFEWLGYGQTPGKWLLNIRVVKTGSGRISFSDALIRNLFRCTYLFPLFFFIPDLICFLFFDERRIGDLAAGTVVIRSKKE